MGFGFGELIVLIALGAVVLFVVASGMWLLRKTFSLVKWLILAGIVLGLFLVVAVAAGVGYFWFALH